MRLPRPTYANVVATVALFVALGGSAIAVSNSIKGKEIKRRSIPANRIKRDVLGTAEINEAKLGPVPAATKAETAARADTSDQAGDSAKLGGSDAGEFEKYGETLPSGRTMAGQFVLAEYDFDTANSTPAFGFTGISFPRPAPVGLTDDQVGFAPGNEAIVYNPDEDPSCAGSPTQPTAPAGRVCLYVVSQDNASANTLQAYVVGPSSRFGFTLQGSGIAQNGFGRILVMGTWAYTAP